MSTPRRTNSRRAPKSPFTSPGADEGFGDNDDQAERMAARRAKAANERARNAASPFKSPGGGPQRSNSRMPPQRSNSRMPPSSGKNGGKLSDDAMQEMYNNCIKLSADNKISTKNTWSLSLIDNIEEMVSSSMAVGADGNMNFQMASGAVEAGVKIYSSRVDSVATEAYKVLGNLSRANNKDAGEEDAADTEGVENDEGGEGPRKRKIRSGVSTLENNEENLNLKDLEYQITTDPLFQKTSASFDEGGAKGMLLNNLNVQNGCQIVFDSSDAIDEGSAEANDSPEGDDELELGDLAGEINDLFSSIGGAELTPGFTQFRLGHMNPQATEKSLVIEEMPSTTFDDDDDGGFVDDGADFDDDDDGAGAPYDGMDEPAAGGTVDAFSSAPTVPGAEEPLDFPLEMMAEDGGDGMRRDFRDSIFGANWAGPGGTWKHSKDKADGSKGKKAPKEKFVLDFSVKVPGSALECAKSPTAFTLSAAALENNTEESTTMPEDLHYQLKDLCTLFTKPSVRVAQGQSAGGGGVGSAAGGDGWYDYGNENDMENFCPDLDAGGMDDDDDCGGGGMGLEDSLADESGMIGAPQLVGDTKINYARAAKKVDVHLLKESIWETIEATPQPLSDATNKVKRDDSVVQGFQSVIGGINNHVPEEKKDMLKDVSVPFCFICLLHLANEKNLVLTDDKLGMLSRLDIGPDGSEGEGTGSCDWATASKNFDKIAGKSGAVRAS